MKSENTKNTFIVLLAILAVGLLITACVQKTATQTSGVNEAVTTPSPPSQPAPIQSAEPEPITEPIAPEAVVRCFDTEEQAVKSIYLSPHKTGLEMTDEGFSFYIIPLDKDGKQMAVSGNLRVMLYSTEEFNGQLNLNEIIYLNAYKITLDDFDKDCNSKKITIKNSAISAEGKYKFVKAGDRGVLRVEFTRTGSQDLFDDEYWPSTAEYVLPPK